MGRPERPLDPGAGAVQGLAHALRELRRAAGGPSYRTMAKAAGFSATTLSQAAAGERLPTLAVVEGYVRACDGDPGEWGPRWKEAEAEVNRVAAAEPDEAVPAAPYRGLARFEPADRHLFFGRDRVSADLHALVRDHRFAVLFGPSGSGKSSLLRAGLIARLQEEIADGTCPARLRILTPGATPATTYGHLLTPTPAEPESWVVVDQFEEIFTLCQDTVERSRFLDLLLAARGEDTRLRVLISVRADFYARCAEHRGLADALRGAALLLGPMTAEELREAVVGPAQAVGCLVERTLTARLLEEVLDEPGGLPMYLTSGYRRVSASSPRPTPPDPNPLRGAGNCATSPHAPAPGTKPKPPTPIPALTTPTLTTPERAFLTAALAARAAEHHTAARTSRRHRILTASLATVLAIAVLTAVAVWHERDDNERQRTQSAARRTADVADGLRTTDPRTALQLGVAAWRTAHLPETRRALLGSLAQAETDAFTDPAPGDTPRRVLADDGRTLLGASGRTWHTWDVTTHRAIGSGRVPGGTVTDADPSAHVLEVTGNDSALRLWNTVTRRWTADSTPHDPGDLHFTGDGRSLLTTEGDHVRLRSVADGHVTFDARAPGAALTAVSADGRTAAACSAGTVHVWNTSNSTSLKGTWQGNPVRCDAVSAPLALAGDQLAVSTATGTSTGLRVWNTATGREVAELPDAGVQYASFGPGGTFMATADSTELRVWRLAAPAAPVFRHDLDNQHLYGGLVWARDGHTLRHLEGGTVHTLDLGESVTPDWRSGAVDDVRFSPDGRTYATAKRTGDHYLFRLHATSDGRVLHTFPPVAVPVSAVHASPTVPADTLPLMAFGPAGTRFTYGVSAPGRTAVAQPFGVWDVMHRRALASLDLPGGAVVAVTLGPDGGHALHAVRTTALGELADETWDFARGHRTAVLTGVTGSHLAVRPDGGLLVGEGRVAALPSGRSTGHDLVQGGQIGALAFGADGSTLAVGDQTGRVDLWDGELRHREGILRNVFPAPIGTAPLGTDPEGVSALAFSPDGATLAVGGAGGSLQLWDVATQQPLSSAPLTTPGEAISSLAFSPDGGTVYAGSAHVPLQRYAVDPERALTRVCARTGNAELTRAQWRTYVPDAPYRRIC